MKLSKKISLGYGLICFVLLTCSVAGYFGVHSLSFYLEYLTGPAWDTADSCMESSIEIQAQIIAAKQLAAGIAPKANLQRYNDAKSAADESMLRLKSAGLLPIDRVEALLAKYQEFKKIRDVYVNTFAEKNAVHDQYQLAKDACLQQLNKPRDGEKEADAWRLKGELLSQLLLIEQMKNLEDFENSAQQLTDARAQFNHEHETSLQQPSLRSVYQSLSKSIDAYQQVLKTQHVALNNFENYTNEFLDFIAVLEDEADGKVEHTKAVLTPAAIRRATWSLSVATVVGLCIGIIAAVVITRSVVGAIRQVVTFSHEIASGNLDQRLHLKSKDEMAEMANSLNIAVENTAHTLATIQKTNERQTTAVDEILTVLHKVAKGDYSQNITVSGDDAIGRLAQGMRDFFDEKQQAELAAEEMNEREKLHQSQRLEEDRKRAQQEKERTAQELLRTQVNQLLEVVSAAATGDLTKDVPFTGTDAIGELAQGLQRMIEDLRDITHEISEGTAQFTEGSQLIAETCQNLAHNAQQQIDGVENISATLGELTLSVQHVVQRVAHANALASESARLAETGGQTVNESMQAMELIKGSSSQIGEIVQVIADIARQTNMLALNAAIEAARAGEHGLGFAVVADEVRKLAERTNSATGEISQLVRDAMLRVDDGVLRSSATSDSLRSILAGVDATAREISQIAITTQTQSHNAQQIKAAVESIRMVTEQNAASSEELASSSEELSSQSQVMRDIVSHFKTTAKLVSPMLPARDRFHYEPTKSSAV